MTKTIYLNDINIFYRIQPISSEDDPQSDFEVDLTLNNTVIYNAVIHPLTRMVIRGVIWYQGI
jgi:hypothetical protein